jgi:hypothetical protein
VGALEETGGEAPPRSAEFSEEKLSLRETFGVFRHNQYLILMFIANFLKVFTPRSDGHAVWWRGQSSVKE